MLVACLDEFPRLEEEVTVRYLPGRLSSMCYGYRHGIPGFKSSISEILASFNFGLGPNPNGECPLLPDG
jgi:hypothetical protein